jgi:hypothetical protein
VAGFYQVVGEEDRSGGGVEERGGMLENLEVLARSSCSCSSGKGGEDGCVQFTNPRCSLSF